MESLTKKSIGRVIAQVAFVILCAAMFGGCSNTTATIPYTTHSTVYFDPTVREDVNDVLSKALKDGGLTKVSDREKADFLLVVTGGDEYEHMHLFYRTQAGDLFPHAEWAGRVHHSGTIGFLHELQEQADSLRDFLKAKIVSHQTPKSTLK